MWTFLRAALLYSGILLALTLPIAILAPRRGRPEMVRRFLIVAAIVVVVASSLEVTGEQLVAQCEEAGNTQCVDYGGLGMLLLFVVPYGVVAVVKAYSLYHE